MQVIFAVIWYIATSLAYIKALTALGYENNWFAFIPYLRDVALTETTLQEKGFYDIPMEIFRFWPVLGIIPVIGWLISIICRCWVYMFVFARLDDVDPQDEKTMAILAAIFTPVAWYKFLTIKDV